MNETKTCPKCNGEMIKGCMMTPNAVKGVRWLKGEPGFMTVIWGLPKIESYSCAKCGFLENFVEIK